MAVRRARSIVRCALVLQATVGLACLDAGPLPAGRHLAADRDEDQVQFLDGPAGQPRRIFLTHAHAEPGSFGNTMQRLSTADDPGPGSSVGALRVVIDDVGQAQYCGFNGCGVPVDALGRLYVVQNTFKPSATSPDFTDELGVLIQVDPATGAQRRFGPPENLQLSTDRTRVVIEVVGVTSTPAPIVLDVDGHELPISGGSLQLVGDDLYFLTEDSHLARLARAALAPEALVADVSTFSATSTQRGPLLLLSHVRAQAGPSTSLFDVSKLAEEPLPPATATAQLAVPSPSGRYLGSYAMNVDGAEPTVLTLFDRDTGQETTADEPPLDAGQSLSLAWRPQHDELWFIANDDVFRWRPPGSPKPVAPDTSLTEAPLRPRAFAPESMFAGPPAFTPDGRFRFVTTIDGTDKPPILVQSADDATAAPVLLNPKGTGVAGVWPLPDGRLLVEDWIADVMRSDIYLIDPAAGTARPLATTGNVVATGRGRFLAIVHYVAAGGSGDLTSIDYATGAETLIAQNVHSVAVDASPDPDDPLAPGTRVAYLVRNRIASPYDGLWVVDLP